MPIVRKVALADHLEQLNLRFDKLKAALEGTSPNPNVYNLYHDDPAQYEEDFREIKELDIQLAIEDFQAILKQLKNVKKFQASKRGR